MNRLTEKNWRDLDYRACQLDNQCCDSECPYDEELREICKNIRIYNRLAAYEDTGMTPDDVKALAEDHKNATLTLEELRKMSGQPVYVENHGWFVIDRFAGDCLITKESEQFDLDEFSIHHFSRNFYRRNPD